jgi:serine/threonine-protein kinase HipA
MRRAEVYMHKKLTGILDEIIKSKEYRFEYDEDYDGPPISLTMPTTQKEYVFDSFPPFFDGLLPEGFQLESLLRKRKIDRNDLFKQLVIVGQDLVGAVSVKEIL